MAEPTDSTLITNANGYLNSKDSTPSKGYWIGLTDSANNGNYVWDNSGTALQAANWYSSNPTRYILLIYKKKFDYVFHTGNILQCHI